MIDGGLRKEFHTHLRQFHWQAIESGLTGGGIPDSNYCVDGKEGWIEYKLTNTYPRLSRKLEPDQVGWHIRRNRAGGRTFIAVRYRHDGGPRLGHSVDILYLYLGSAACSLAVSGLAIAPIGRWEGGPSRWNWERIGRFLLE